MQAKCVHCSMPFTISRDEVLAMLDEAHTEGYKHANVDCPSCGKLNKMSTKQLKRGAPGWSPAKAKAAKTKGESDSE